jgi:hypothetical protein
LSIYREWATNNAINTITTIYNKKKEMRKIRYQEYLQQLPYWPIYEQYRGRPPLHPHLVAELQRRIAEADLDLKRDIDADWKACVVRYPEVLNHFYSQINVALPRQVETPFTNSLNAPPRPPAPNPQSQQLAQTINRGMSATAPPKKQRRSSKISTERDNFDDGLLDHLTNQLAGLQRVSTGSSRKSSTPAPPNLPHAPTPGPRAQRPSGKRRESKEYVVSGRGQAPPHVPQPPNWHAPRGTFDMGGL